MEQQKVLIIIISAALFIAAVLGVGLALFYPDSTGTATATAREFDPIEYARTPDKPQNDESVIVYGSEEEDGSAEEESKERVILLTEESPADEEPAQDLPEEETRVTSRSAREERAPVAANEETEKPAPSEPVRQPAREPAPSSTPQPRQSTATSAGYERAPEPEPTRIRVTEHWIQLISSPNKERVDMVRDRLREEYSLGARVTTTEVDGRTYYRLRLGPYDDRGEAEKFLAWIREIDGFGEAYISEEYPLRTVR